MKPAKTALRHTAVHPPIARRLRPPGAALVLLALLLSAAVLGACDPDASDFTARPASAAAPAAAASTATEPAERVIFLGDSLTAGPGLVEEETYPALIANRLHDQGYDVDVVNAGVSGDTTAGGLARLDWLLDQKPAVLVVGLGANDGLRGLPLDRAEENLRTIVGRARDAGARVLLLGMKIPPSQGLDYAERFEEMYPRIADDLNVPLVPFLLDGVAARPSLNMPDRIHPNALGHRQLAANVYPYLEDILDQIGPTG